MSSFLIALLVPIVLAALGVTVRPQARRIGSERVVEYGAGLRVYALISATLAALVALVSLFLSAAERPWILGISGMFAMLAAFLLPHAYLTQVVFGQDGITARSPWRKPLFVAWSDIVNVRYSAGEKSYIVVVPSGTDLKLHAYMSGVPELVTEMQQRGVSGALLAQATAG